MCQNSYSDQKYVSWNFNFLMCYQVDFYTYRRHTIVGVVPKPDFSKRYKGTMYLVPIYFQPGTKVHDACNYVIFAGTFLGTCIFRVFRRGTRVFYLISWIFLKIWRVYFNFGLQNSNLVIIKLAQRAKVAHTMKFLIQTCHLSNTNQSIFL